MPPEEKGSNNIPKPELSKEDYDLLYGTKERERANYFLRHWRGDLSLAVSYWVNGVLFTFVINLIVNALQYDALARSNFRLYVFISFLILTFEFVFWLWFVVGAWRSAENHISKTKRKFWANAAKVMVVFSFIGTAVTYSTNSGIYKDFFIIALGIDEYSEYNVTTDKTLKVINVDGHIGYGLTDEVSSLLDKNPDTSTINLESIGGRPWEARLLRDLIIKNGLSTSSYKGCASACTVVFLAGKSRILGDKAILGFHQYIYKDYVPNFTSQNEMKIDREFLLSQGVPEKFVVKAYSTPNSDLWKPNKIELFLSNVITGVDDGGDILGVRDFVNKYWLEFEKGLREIRLYEVMKTNDAEEYSAMERDVYRAISKGVLGTTELASLIRSHVSKSVEKFLGGASNESLQSFFNLLIKQLDNLGKNDPEACRSYLFPKDNMKSVNLESIFSKEMRDNEIQVMSEILASNNLFKDQILKDSEFDEYMSPIYLKLSSQFNVPLELLETPYSPKVSAKQICDFARTMYQEINRLSQDIRYRAFRYLYSF